MKTIYSLPSSNPSVALSSILSKRLISTRKTLLKSLVGSVKETQVLRKALERTWIEVEEVHEMVVGDEKKDKAEKMEKMVGFGVDSRLRKLVFVPHYVLSV
jgi:hypothetical protein